MSALQAQPAVQAKVAPCLQVRSILLYVCVLCVLPYVFPQAVVRGVLRRTSARSAVQRYHQDGRRMARFKSLFCSRRVRYRTQVFAGGPLFALGLVFPNLTHFISAKPGSQNASSFTGSVMAAHRPKC
jgi:hypothetical protein